VGFAFEWDFKLEWVAACEGIKQALVSAPAWLCLGEMRNIVLPLMGLVQPLVRCYRTLIRSQDWSILLCLLLSFSLRQSAIMLELQLN
jgi:hypothetical protein